MVRLRLSLLVSQKYKRRILDVKNAFLKVVLKETKYVKQPKGFVRAGQENRVYVLRKALYGLLQSSKK